MDRRALGALLLLVTLLVVAVAPRIGSSPVSGVAVAVDILGPPTVGDCVLSDPTAAGASVKVQSLKYGSCSTPHYGEVVQVYSDWLSLPNTGPDQIRALSPTACEGAAHAFLAVDQVEPRYDRGDYKSVSFGPWHPAPVGGVGLIGPDAVQRAVGQDWIACITEGVRPAAADGTVREAFSGGRLPDSYTLCSDQLVAGTSVNCASRHRTELFAVTGLVEALPAQAELDISCAGFVRYLTGRKDLTTKTGIEVKATVLHHTVTDHSTPGAAEAFCGVSTVGSAMLTASLFAFGDRPLPLS